LGKRRVTPANGTEKAQKHAHGCHDRFGPPNPALPYPRKDKRAECLRLKVLGLLSKRMQESHEG